MSSLRDAFPVLQRATYLNSGSVGPVATASVSAAEHAMRDALLHGRASKAQFEAMIAQADNLRDAIATIFGATLDDVALTNATTDGINAVISGLDLGPGDEVLTSDEEHPGLLVPLAMARQRRGIEIRTVPLAEIESEAGPKTKLIACSHVSWQTGRVVDTAGLAAADALVLLDGAQGLGAVPTDAAEMGCDFYAASGQKWLCGPTGTGYLYVRPGAIEHLSPAAPGYQTITDGERALELPLRDGARRFDSGMLASEASAWALAAIGVLAAAGYAEVIGAGIDLSARFAAALTEKGLTVAPRGQSTLVSWEVADPEGESLRLLGEGFVVRNLPGTPYVRASVGAWNDEDELERLVSVVSPT